jgi:putative peptidoglycan lipid II flippase
LLFLIPFVIAAIIFMPYILHVTAPGFVDEPEKFAMAVYFSRITFSYLFFMSLVAYMGSMLNSHHYFMPFAASSIIFNLVMVGGLLTAVHYDWFRGEALSWSLTVSGFLQILWMFSHMVGRRIKVTFKGPKLTPDMRKLFRLMGPGALGAGVVQINLFVDIILASLLPTGAISYLFYADRLNQLPLGIIGVAMGTALLPVLSRANANGDMAVVNKHMEDSLLYGFFLAMPAAIALMVMPNTILRVLFERGEFTSFETMQVSKAIFAYAIGVPAYVLTKVYNAACFAREDTKTPVIIASIIAVSNAALAYSLIHVLGHMGIALATGLVAWANVYMLSWALHKKTGYRISNRLRLKLAGVLIASFVMGASLYFMDSMMLSWTMGATFEKIVGLGFLVLVGSILYFLSCLVMRVFDMDLLKVFVKKK